MSDGDPRIKVFTPAPDKLPVSAVNVNLNKEKEKKKVTFDDLVKMIEPGEKHPILINTLSKEDFEKKHIPGSINIPAAQIAQKAPQLFSKHDWLVVYCANSQCTQSQKA